MLRMPEASQRSAKSSNASRYFCGQYGRSCSRRSGPVWASQEATTTGTLVSMDSAMVTTPRLSDGYRRMTLVPHGRACSNRRLRAAGLDEKDEKGEPHGPRREQGARDRALPAHER